MYRENKELFFLINLNIQTMLDITLPSHFVVKYWGNYFDIVIEKRETLFLEDKLIKLTTNVFFQTKIIKQMSFSEAFRKLQNIIW